VLVRGLCYCGLTALVLRFGDGAVRQWRKKPVQATAVVVAVLQVIHGATRYPGKGVMG